MLHCNTFVTHAVRQDRNWLLSSPAEPAARLFHHLTSVLRVAWGSFDLDAIGGNTGLL